MPPESASSKLWKSAPIFAALGDETRLRLVSNLCERGPQSITRLAAGTGVTRQAVTKHLNVLEEAGLVSSHRLGRERIWELEKYRLEVAQSYLNAVSHRWDDALGRLKNLVEES